MNTRGGTTERNEAPQLFPPYDDLPDSGKPAGLVSLARKTYTIKNAIRDTPYLIKTVKVEKDIQRYADKYITEPPAISIIDILKGSIDRGMFPAELVKKTKIVRKKKKSSEDALSVFDRVGKADEDEDEDG
eukprot:TRINITY_DN4453_c0_g1_i1.p1 TRINITY_DN4453_c0_g1~~TRINITY_DN4453_c0_g1_i1.p1  ORF type:complete len:131 (-),score=15.45 TRINITY_DN4453_c0_g1_i1:46-438(-)